MAATRRSAKISPAGAKNGAEIARSVNALADGHNDAFAEVTLTANATSTVVDNPRINESAHIHFTPLTANAAAEYGAGAMYVSARQQGSFTISHANNAQTDRTFSYGWNG